MFHREPSAPDGILPGQRTSQQIEKTPALERPSSSCRNPHTGRCGMLGWADKDVYALFECDKRPQKSTYGNITESITPNLRDFRLCGPDFRGGFDLTHAA